MRIGDSGWRVPPRVLFCAAVLAALSLVSLSGCGSGAEVSEEHGDRESSAEHEAEQLRSLEFEPEPAPWHESDEGEGHDSGDEHGSEGEHGEESGESGIRWQMPSIR